MENIVLLIERLENAADLPLPAYQTAGAAGMDLVAANPKPIKLGIGKVALIPTGLKVEIPLGYEAQIRPRSGLALKYGIFIVNSPGTIDADYRGEIGVILGNFSDTEFIVKRGDRVAQMVVQAVVRAEIKVVPQLSATARGQGGFGSTGLERRV
ncbi:MAG: dUTP diphosphatase [Planctomycetota bacterium]|nr:dUTP diphosphatase [Planctomycetota bacterium]